MDTSPPETETTVDATQFVRYIDRTREYYAAQGFERPYRWASFSTVPLTPLSETAAGALERSTVTLITTANHPAPAGWQAGGPRPPRRVYSVPSNDVPPSFYTDDLGWDKKATHTDELGSYFPISVLQELVSQGRLGALAQRCHGVPTEYSHRRTREQDGPEILRRCREDQTDIALLVPL